MIIKLLVKKKKFLEEVVKKIIVKKTDVQQREGKIELRLPYMDDGSV